MTAYPPLRPVHQGVRPGRRRVVAVLAVVATFLLGAGTGIAVLVLRSQAERAAQSAAERAAVTYAERQVGRAGATILVGEWWEGCGIYELGLDEVRLTVAVVEVDGAWRVARESGKPAYTFHADNSHTRADCLDIAA